MIVVRLIGGLGNQLFQYAAGRALALANGCELRLDISGFNKYALHHGYELGIFNIKAEIANQEDTSVLAGSQSRLARYARRKLNLTRKTHFVERKFAFDPAFFNIKQPAYLDGYWQSYKYLEPCAMQIRDELRFNKPLTGRNLETAEHIDRIDSVSIHIRRGDYVSKSGAHGFVGIGYYNKAITRIREEIDSPVFFVFSDDLTWARGNLQLGNGAIFVSHNTGVSSYEDMRLMSLCKHNIIANSTFSWWAAWLNVNTNKIVVCPSQWLADPSVVPSYKKFI